MIQIYPISDTGSFPFGMKSFNGSYCRHAKGLTATSILTVPRSWARLHLFLDAVSKQPKQEDGSGVGGGGGGCC